MCNEYIAANVSSSIPAIARSTAVGNSKPGGGWRTLEILSFLVFATAGMLAIAVAVLSPAVAGYCSDRAVIQASLLRIESLQELQCQHAELLANTDQPAVIERSAISNLRYQPTEAADSELVPLPAVWDELENALERIEKPPDSTEIRYYQQLAENLAERPLSRIMLSAVGSLLVLLSLSCFNRSY